MSVIETLEAAGVPYVVHTHEPIRGEADLHLTRLNWETSVKTLAFELPDGRTALVAVRGPARVQYGAIAKALGVSRSNLQKAGEDRILALGMEPGGVSPICSDPEVIVVIDATVFGMGVVYCGGGTCTSTIEIDADAIARVACAPIIAAITRD